MRPHSNWLALLICVFFFILAMRYASVTPSFEAADEDAHFLYMHNLLIDRDLPVIRSREQVAAETQPTRLWAIENHQPPLYYVIGAPLISWTQRDDVENYLRSNDLIFIRGTVEENYNKWLHDPTEPPGDMHKAIWVLRLYSTVLGCMTLCFVFLAARQIFEQPFLPLLAMLLTASIPTFVSISASINNDNLVTMLYAAGVYLCRRMWRKRSINDADIGLTGLVLAAIALTKITGLSLVLIVYLSLLIGTVRGYYPRKDSWRLAWVSAMFIVVGAGWWYMANWSQYGDPLALGATQSIWGREYEIAATSGDILRELQRIAQSFWLMIGHLHQPVYGPEWFYLYALVITLLGVAGLGLVIFRKSPRLYTSSIDHDAVYLLAAVCGVVIVMLLIGTRSVDISYGRLLFPALVGFSPLMVWGWWRLFARFAALLLLPLIVMALVTPETVIQPAYAPLERVERLPENARPINASAETLRLLAYDLNKQSVKPGDMLELALYIRGRHMDNPALLITAVDAVTLERLGHVEQYPGMAPTDVLDPEHIYRVPLRLRMNSVEAVPRRPRQVLIQVQWHSPGAFRDIPLTLGEDDQRGSLLLDGPVLLDDRYSPPAPQVEANTRFAERIVFNGFTLSEQDVTPGDTLTVTAHWTVNGSFDTEYILTVQLLDANGTLLTQQDGSIAGYPAWAWIPGTRFTETRTLAIPEDAAPGSYRLLVGWYRLEDFERLHAAGGTIENNLVVLPHTVTVYSR